MKVIVRRINNQGWIIVVETSSGVVYGNTVFNTKNEAITEAQHRNPEADIKIDE